MARNLDGLVSRLRDLKMAPAEIRRYVEENFSQERMARDYHDLYTRIITKPRNTSEIAA